LHYRQLSQHVRVELTVVDNGMIWIERISCRRDSPFKRLARLNTRSQPGIEDLTGDSILWIGGIVAFNSRNSMSHSILVCPGNHSTNFYLDIGLIEASDLARAVKRKARSSFHNINRDGFLIAQINKRAKSWILFAQVDSGLILCCSVVLQILW